jgi:hypothetical protein
LVRELQRGDVVLMVLLVKEEKGWNFGSTRIRTATERDRRHDVLGCACAGGGRIVYQEGTMRCGNAGGARNWRGAAETADGGG